MSRAAMLAASTRGTRVVVRTGWVRPFLRAVGRNLEALRREAHPTTPERIDEAFRRVPYRFDGPDHYIADVEEVDARGYAACADAAAAILAAALVHGMPAGLCLEMPPPSYKTPPGYSHVRVIVGARVFDPYATERPSSPESCEWYATSNDVDVNEGTITFWGVT